MSKQDSEVDKVINQKSTKGNKEMKTKFNGLFNFTKTVLPWLILFALLCGGVGYYMGQRDKAEYNLSVKAEAVALSKSLKQSQK